MSEDEAVLQQALSLYQERRYQESEAAFEQIRMSPVVGYRALAGLGMIHIAQNQMPAGAALFESSLKQKPNADAFYGLGYISEVSGDVTGATSLYARALQQNPSHTAASRRLDAIAQQRSFPPPPPSQPTGSLRPPVTVPAAEDKPPVVGDPRQPDTVSYAYSDSDVPAFYTILAGDNSELSQRTLQLLSRLTIENRRPRYSAYPGRILAFPILLGIVLVFLFGLSQSHGRIDPVVLLFLAFLLVCLLIAFVKLVNVARTRYTIKDGWIKVELGHGFLQKRDKAEEVTHLLETSLEQGLVETMTNNAVLVLNFGHNLARMRVRGLAPRGELKKIRGDLNNLYRMLRSNPLLKGLVT
jgi:tetratricopeptide (TPR) repeat protein